MPYEFNAVRIPAKPGLWFSVLPGVLPMTVDRYSELDLRTLRSNWPTGNEHLYWGPIEIPALPEQSK